MQEESYTSGCSAIDIEPVTKKYYNKSRRITRGLFKSGYGILNADINGSLNILRKAEKCIPLLESDFNYSECLKAIKDYIVKGCIIVEGPMVEKDALLVKNTYEKL
ncbi:hypothetical protein [Clostridium botulinum]|uniref:hypothetical protein n=1 Tax=Clostridium botulinum TaxID=1491 RepID=UPI00096DA109|nr:hypothetical protein [Clostridium botulinum]